MISTTTPPETKKSTVSAGELWTLSGETARSKLTALTVSDAKKTRTKYFFPYLDNFL
ncbi:MAG: hypothetical protein SPC24_06035 [Alphaproteobacteria bacterium]|nr:hypothetical protein [Alphaproteobacteria bacterium]